MQKSFGSLFQRVPANYQIRYQVQQQILPSGPVRFFLDNYGADKQTQGNQNLRQAVFPLVVVMVVVLVVMFVLVMMLMLVAVALVLVVMLVLVVVLMLMAVLMAVLVVMLMLMLFASAIIVFVFHKIVVLLLQNYNTSDATRLQFQPSTRNPLTINE